MKKLTVLTFPTLILFCGLALAQSEVDQLRARADKGDVSAQLTLAKRYFLGVGVEKDEAEAVKWLRKAAEQNEPQSERILGMLCETGTAGVPKDEAQAANWYRKAAQKDDAAAQDKLGDMYDTGRGGLTKDPRQALEWYLKAAQQGVIAAQSKIGEMYENGRGGLPKDETEAVSWYRKAADQGYPAAMNGAARLYISKNPEVRNPAAGLEYARRAVEAKKDDPAFLSTLAQAYSLYGQYNDAVETQQKALALAPAGEKASYDEKLSEYQRELDTAKRDPSTKLPSKWPRR